MNNMLYVNFRFFVASLKKRGSKNADVIIESGKKSISWAT